MRKQLLFPLVFTGIWLIWDTEYGAGISVTVLVLLFIGNKVFKSLTLRSHNRKHGPASTSGSSGTDVESSVGTD